LSAVDTQTSLSLWVRIRPTRQTSQPNPNLQLQ
jgi:hypothetical protein